MNELIEQHFALCITFGTCVTMIVALAIVLTAGTSEWDRYDTGWDS